MTFVLTAALQAGIRTGDTDAFRCLVDGCHRSLFNLFFKATEDRAGARQLTQKAFRTLVKRIGTGEALERPFAEEMVDLARDTCFEGMPSDLYRKTLFVCARELLTEPVELLPLPAEFLNADGHPNLHFDTGFKGALTAPQLLILELLFIDRCSISHLAEILTVNENVLAGFVYGVLDMLGDLSTLEHKLTCTRDIFLGLKMVDLQDDHQALQKLEAEHGACPSCAKVIHRCHRIIRLFQIDSRIAAKPDEALLASLAPPSPAPKPSMPSLPPMRATAGRITLLPMRARATPGTFTYVFRLATVACVGSAFAWTAVHVVQSHRLRPETVARRVKTAPSPIPGRKMVGTYTNPFATDIPIYDDTVLRSAKNHKTEIGLDGGGAVLMQPGSSVRFRTGEVTILEGQVGVTLPRGGQLRVGTEALGGPMKDGDVLVDRERGKRTRFLVVKGLLELAGDGKSVKVESFRQATYNEKLAKLDVVDLKDAELAAARLIVPADTAAVANVSAGPRTPAPIESSSPPAETLRRPVVQPSGAGTAAGHGVKEFF